MKKILLFTFFSVSLLIVKSQPYSNADVQCGAPFYHGVASGDPLTDRIIIWTRVTAKTKQPVTVHWRMAKDTGMTQVVNAGTFITGDSIDYTVKVDVTGLHPDTYYYYDFETGGNYSIRGRTHTVPVSGVATQRFAVVSCQNWEDGYYNAYNRITARNDVSGIIFLGDYIYEYKTGDYSSNIDGRVNDPKHECVTLKDYRTRYAEYHSDPDIIKCHQQYPWMIIWDDHEFADNAYKNGAENHQSGTEGDWETRKQNAMEAWREWLPVRLPDAKNPEKIYRKLTVGNLINFYFLDTRMIARDKQLSVTDSHLDDTDRYMVGQKQMNWLMNDLAVSTAKWNIICQQVMVAPCEAFGVPVNTDAWDGYPAERNRLINGLAERKINNAVVLTGDFHSSWGNDIPTDHYNSNTNTGAAGVEFVTSSITSQNFGFPIPDYLIKVFNPHVQYVDLTHHGYILLDVKSGKTTGEWYNVQTVREHSTVESFSAAYYVNGTEKHLQRANNATVSIPVPAPQAPGCPVALHAVAVNDIKQGISPGGLSVMKIYPDPFFNEINAEYVVDANKTVTISLADMQGRTLILKTSAANKGINYIRLHANDIPAGTYMFSVIANGNAAHKLLVKLQ